ncbi:COPI associated protein [Spironucleus salmonicida]|uniref:COPI associated protein n=1 Tax=Spironucleus salmonicida TaxID=348837 RepID=V6LMG2_9EUKA|nr:COPI associated protein [Spironucleus salmonicida]|eukprot:EST45882.1 COPI associated protein [Spironucleus salmonicida]
MDVWWIIDTIVCVLYMVSAIWGDAQHDFKGDDDMSEVFQTILIILLSLFIILTPPISALQPYFGFLTGKGAPILIIIIACFFLPNFSYSKFCRDGGFSCFTYIVGIIGVVVGLLQLFLGGSSGGSIGGGSGQQSKPQKKEANRQTQSKDSKKLPPINQGSRVLKTV